MFIWLDRIIGDAVSALPGLFLVLLGASQILVAGIMVDLLLFHTDKIPVLVAQNIMRVWFATAFVALLGISLIAAGLWMAKHLIYFQKFKL